MGLTPTRQILVLQTGSMLSGDPTMKSFWKSSGRLIQMESFTAGLASAVNSLTIPMESCVGDDNSSTYLLVVSNFDQRVPVQSIPFKILSLLLLIVLHQSDGDRLDYRYRHTINQHRYQCSGHRQSNSRKEELKYWYMHSVTSGSNGSVSHKLTPNESYATIIGSIGVLSRTEIHSSSTKIGKIKLAFTLSLTSFVL